MNLIPEFVCANFNNKKLTKRLLKIVQSIASNITDSVSGCMQTWSETQAAYRFFANPKVTPEETLATHQEQTLLRMRGHETILLVQDTSDIMAKNLKEAAYITNENQKGMLIHPTLAITTDRLCLGIFHFKYWHRPELNQDKGPNIEDKESIKWLEPLRKAEEIKKEGQRLVVSETENPIFLSLFQRVIRPIF